MDRLEIEVFVPSIGESFDVVLASDVKVSEACTALGKMLEDVTDNRYSSSGSELICCVNRNLLLKNDRYLSDYSIKTGDLFILL